MTEQNGGLLTFKEEFGSLISKTGLGIEECANSIGIQNRTLELIATGERKAPVNSWFYGQLLKLPNTSPEDISTLLATEDAPKWEEHMFVELVSRTTPDGFSLSFVGPPDTFSAEEIDKITDSMEKSHINFLSRREEKQILNWLDQNGLQKS